VAGGMASILSAVQAADAEPTSQVIAAARQAHEEMEKLAGRIHEIRSGPFADVNKKLRAAGLEGLKIEP